MTGLRNFRDFAAGAIAGSHALPIGRFFRSGHLARLDPASRNALLAHRWRLVIDLRYPDEQLRDPSPWPEGMQGRLGLSEGSAREAPHFEMFMAARANAARMDEVYTAYYRDLPFDPLYRPLFAEAVRRIGQTRGPVLIHCTAGKDRTGILVALLLELMGVDADAISADYLRSAEVVTAEFTRAVGRQLFEQSGEQPAEEEVRAMLAVAPAYLAAAQTGIRDRYGSVETYLRASGLTAADIDAARHCMARGDDAD
ncbi:MAG: tyrosine-protein phosphatase [Sphingomonadales bacterium]|nr:tyrosine-protein phosphatase [Sphingomonadales bacterium]